MNSAAQQIIKNLHDLREEDPSMFELDPDMPELGFIDLPRWEAWLQEHIMAHFENQMVCKQGIVWEMDDVVPYFTLPVSQAVAKGLKENELVRPSNYTPKGESEPLVFIYAWTSPIS